ncbi:MAG: hypothetical protein N2Z73_04675, partial [Endomicrobia bacterium]|nr:hypothetical protein [Endomicrobiia bacterium]
ILRSCVVRKNIDGMKKFYSGDNWVLNYTIYDAEGKPLNLTGVEIRAELKNVSKNVSIKKASSNVSGGHSSQIEIVNAQKGQIKIKFYNTETQNLLPDIYDFEVEIRQQSTGLQYTVIREKFEVLKDIITWINKT